MRLVVVDGVAVHDEQRAVPRRVARQPQRLAHDHPAVPLDGDAVRGGADVVVEDRAVGGARAVLAAQSAARAENGGLEQRRGRALAVAQRPRTHRGGAVLGVALGVVFAEERGHACDAGSRHGGAAGEDLRRVEVVLAERGVVGAVSGSRRQHALARRHEIRLDAAVERGTLCGEDRDVVDAAGSTRGAHGVGARVLRRTHGEAVLEGGGGANGEEAAFGRCAGSGEVGVDAGKPAVVSRGDDDEEVRLVVDEVVEGARLECVGVA
mmetsp:Transcript_21959/g.54263  ORF Transcript_21959/g.54263 Transcript_21959/m.54263 type:complete len:266 (+) Transcript_21959:1059-1856(+)